MTTFARLSRPVQDQLRPLPKAAAWLYTRLLERYPAGQIQLVCLDELADELGYHVRTMRRKLRELIDHQLVDLVHQYSANVFKLIAHDDRTLSLSLGQSQPQNIGVPGSKDPVSGSKDPTDGTKRSTLGASTPHSLVTKNRERSRDNRDTQPSHPVKEIKPKDNLSKLLSPEAQAVSESASDHLRQAIRETLKQPLNKNILVVLLKYPESRSRDALDSLREVIPSGKVKNPAGWLINAIRKGFKPKHPASPKSAAPKPQAPDGFQVWFELAFKAGVAVASGRQNGELMIYGSDSAEPFEQAQQTWPIEKLQAIVQRPAPAPLAALLQSPIERSVPSPSPQSLQDKQQRKNALARLQAKWKWGTEEAREDAIAEAKLWGLNVTEAGISSERHNTTDQTAGHI